MSDSESSDNYEPVDDANKSVEENEFPLGQIDTPKSPIVQPIDDENDLDANDDIDDEEVNDEEINDGEVNEDETAEQGHETEGAKRFKAPAERLTRLPLSRIKTMMKNFDPEWKGQSSEAAIMLVLVRPLLNVRNSMPAQVKLAYEDIVIVQCDSPRLIVIDYFKEYDHVFRTLQ